MTAAPAIARTAPAATPRKRHLAAAASLLGCLRRSTSSSRSGGSSSTARRTPPGLFGGGSALWFADDIDYLGNLQQLFTYDGGIYLRWLGNSALYAFAGGIGATVLAVLAGYGFAKFRFRGRELAFAILLGSVMVPLDRARHPDVHPVLAGRASPTRSGRSSCRRCSTRSAST